MNLKIYKKTRYQNIYKHINNGTYAVDLSLGYNEIGKRIRTTRTGLFNIDEAKKILSDSKLKSDLKIKVSNKYLFKELWSQYREDCIIVKRLAYNTMKKKDYAYNNFISKFFDDYDIFKISKIHIAKFHDYLDEKSIDNRTKYDIHKILSAFFNWCVEEEKIPKNPVKAVENYSYEEKEKTIWDVKQFTAFITCTENDFKSNPFKAILTATVAKLFFLGGFRLEELLALKKGIITDDAVQIRKAVVFETGVGYVEKDTKTKSSERNIDFGEKMIKSIKDYINFVETYYNIKYEDTDYIFTNITTMRIYSDNTIRRYINYYADMAKIPHITPRMLRHSHATLLHDLGWDMFDISKRLGHSNTNVTSKIYCHLSDNRRKNIASDMDKIL